MSEEKTNEPVKQEGEFKIKKKTPKKLTPVSDEPIKVNIKEPLVDLPPEVTKVAIPKQEEDAIQIGETKEVSVEEPSGDSAKVGEPLQESNKTTEGFSPIKEITEEQKQEVIDVKVEAKKAIQDEKILGKALPENIEKLVSFMEDTGGNVEDYVRLNADYSNVKEDVLLKEYYLKTKPYLEPEDVDLLLEDYTYDEDLDEDRDIRKKKIAFKEEVAKAKSFLEETKSKYYDEIKLRPGVTQDQQKATDFFNRYNEDQSRVKERQELFKSNTKELFNNEFKGFDFEVGEKKFRYGIQNKESVAEKQSDINNFVGKFLDSEGNVSDPKGYHKALYAAMNADKLASHFYEQGKADAVREVVTKSKNPGSQARQTSDGNVFVNGLKVKSISGADSTKLRIKTKKFN